MYYEILALNKGAMFFTQIGTFDQYIVVLQLILLFVLPFNLIKIEVFLKFI